MSKQEEIREGIAKRCVENCDGATQRQCDELVTQYGSQACKYCGADQVLSYLHSQGVARVRRPLKGEDLTGSAIMFVEELI